jgi:hypothetical protein
LFTYGLIFSDIEHLSKGYGRPLDALRNLSIWIKIPINLVLAIIFMSYGSLIPDDQCKVRDDGDCAFYDIISFYGGSLRWFWLL